jgi:putative ABC transport system permease protein
MRWLASAYRRIRGLFCADEIQREIDEELRFHIDMRTAENISRGMPAEEARLDAGRRFGNLMRTKERGYEVRGGRWLESLWLDLRYGARMLRRNPGFTAVAIISLALGIGANNAIFTLVDQILLRLLPVHNPQELVQLETTGGAVGSNWGDSRQNFSYPTYLALRDRNTVFSGLTGHRVGGTSLIGEGSSEMVNVGMVAGNFFEVLGIRPYLGRLLTQDDDKTRMGRPVAVLQYDFWQKQFAGNPDIIGSKIQLRGTSFTVIGVSAPGFDGIDVGLQTQVWIPVTMSTIVTNYQNAFDDERFSWFYLFGRLKPGVSIDEAQAAMRVLYAQRREEELKSGYFQRFPADRDRFLHKTFNLVSAARGQSSLRGQFGQMLIVLQWLVGFVLLIACTNVANLLLARGAARQRELAIRGALGAGRFRLIRQLFVESSLLALIGGTAGLLLSSWLTRGLIRILPFDPANLALSASPDLRILLFATVITFLTALFFGLLPAIRGSRVSPEATLKEEAGSIAGGHGHVRLRKAFVTLQVGLSCLLLIGAGLFARTFQNLKNVDLGFNAENIVRFEVLTAAVYDNGRKLQNYRSLMERLAAVLGVKAVGATDVALFTGDASESTFTLPGADTKGETHPWSLFNWITPGYFEAMGIPIKAGRDLSWSDWGSSRKLCLVNESLVKRYLGGANPVGRSLAVGAKNTPDTEIIGVFGDARYDHVRGRIPRQIFVAMDANTSFPDGINVFARIQGDPRAVMPQLREQVRRVDPNLVVHSMRMLDDQLNVLLSEERMLSLLSVGFASLACLLAVIGLHGVLTFVVARRTREIGIRIALGADKGNVIRLVMSEMVPLILIGIAAGVIAGLLSGRLVESQLFGVKATDLYIYVICVVVMLMSALAAALLPAWRATRIDPMTALRLE